MKVDKDFKVGDNVLYIHELSNGLDISNSTIVSITNEWCVLENEDMPYRYLCFYNLEELKDYLEHIIFYLTKNFAKKPSGLCKLYLTTGNKGLILGEGFYDEANEEQALIDENILISKNLCFWNLNQMANYIETILNNFINNITK